MSRTSRSLILAAVAVALVGAVMAAGLWSMMRKRQVVLGAKNFTESRILMEIMAQWLEQETGLSVDRRELGSTTLCYEGLRTGALDLYAEYSGTLLTDIFRMEPIAAPAEALVKVSARIEKENRLRMLQPFGFNDTYVLAMRRDRAAELNIRTLSDLQAHPSLKAGFTSEFNQRADGFPGLAKYYALNWDHAPVDLAPGHMYGAVVDGHVDIISAFSTDARIAKFDLVALADDKLFFPAYQAVPLLRREFAETHPDAVKALSALVGTLNDSAMQALNYQVDVEGLPVPQVASEFIAGLASR